MTDSPPDKADAEEEDDVPQRFVLHVGVDGDVRDRLRETGEVRIEFEPEPGLPRVDVLLTRDADDGSNYRIDGELR